MLLDCFVVKILLVPYVCDRNKTEFSILLTHLTTFNIESVNFRILQEPESIELHTPVKFNSDFKKVNYTYLQ